MTFMTTNKGKASKAQDLIDESTDEIAREREAELKAMPSPPLPPETVVALDDLDLIDRIRRLEMLVEQQRKEIELIATHTHDAQGRMVVPF